MATDENVQDVVRELRRRLAEVESARVRAVGELRYALVGAALAVGMLALTATNWMTGEDDSVYSLWGLVPEHWFALLTLVLVVVLALTTIGAALSDGSSRTTHIVLVVLAVLAAAAVLFVGSVTPAGPVDAEDFHTAPGQWLTLLAALALATLHGARAEELKQGSGGARLRTW